MNVEFCSLSNLFHSSIRCRYEDDTMKKKHAILIVIIVLVTVHAFAVDYPEPTSWVNDYVGVLTAEQKQELDAILQDFERKTTHQIFVSIMNSLPPDIAHDHHNPE